MIANTVDLIAAAARHPAPAATFPDPEDDPDLDVPEEPAPWRDVTTDDIQGVIDGTFLGEMAQLYAGVTVPTLPLEAALLKAIVTAGCALSTRPCAK